MEAAILAVMGRREQALDALERAEPARGYIPHQLQVWGVYVALTHEPRFQALLAKRARRIW